MPGPELLVPFIVASLLFAFFPGPAMLYTVAQTLARGRAAGVSAVLGLHLGGYVHVAAAALGLAAIFHHVPAAYLALKLAGAAYLIWLGIGMVLQPIGAEDLPQVARRSPLAPFANSVLVQVLNPKVALFFLAFLPQFTDPAAGWPLWAQLLLLGVVVNVCCTLADLTVVALTDRVLVLLRHLGAAGRTGRRWPARAARWGAGGTLILLGGRLALTRD